MNAHFPQNSRNPGPRRTAWACAVLCGVALVLASALPAWARNHWALSISLVQNLSFTPVEQGVGSTYVVAALDPTAAIFDAAGQKNQWLTVTVVEASILMTKGGGGTPQTEIPVDTWSFGGSLTDLGGSGDGRIDGTGSLANMRIGASATVAFDNEPGSYTGSATFRVVYK